MSSKSINPIFENRVSLSFVPMKNKIKLSLEDMPAPIKDGLIFLLRLQWLSLLLYDSNIQLDSVLMVAITSELTQGISSD